MSESLTASYRNICCAVPELQSKLQTRIPQQFTWEIFLLIFFRLQVRRMSGISPKSLYLETFLIGV